MVTPALRIVAAHRRPPELRLSCGDHLFNPSAYKAPTIAIRCWAPNRSREIGA
jgi:hypothetical protein